MISKFSKRRSLIHQAHPIVRLIVFYFIIPAATIVAEWQILIFISIIFLILLKISNIGYATFWIESRYYILFLLVFLCFLSLVIYSGPFLTRIFTGMIIATRLIIVIGCGILASLTTNPNDLPGGLLQIGIPHRFAMLLVVALKLYPLARGRMSIIREAACARGINPLINLINPNSMVNSLAILVGPIVVQTLELGVYLSDTMLSRGYDPYKPITVPPNIKLSSIDVFLLVISLGILLLSIGLKDYLFNGIN